MVPHTIMSAEMFLMNDDCLLGWLLIVAPWTLNLKKEEESNRPFTN